MPEFDGLAAPVSNALGALGQHLDRRRADTRVLVHQREKRPGSSPLQVGRLAAAKLSSASAEAKNGSAAGMGTSDPVPGRPAVKPKSGL